MIRIDSDTGQRTTVRFPYDAEAVEIIRTIPGRRWNPQLKQWTIPADEATLAASRFRRAGFSVVLNGVAFDDRPRAVVTGFDQMLVGILHGIPERLRQPTYRALSRVWHPDAGGDTVLMQSLNQAHAQPTPGGST